MPEPATVAPLAVLSEDWPLRDVLLLTFNSNLGFFERAALSRVRSRGARVTLVSDADMVHADPETVRFSGRTYLDGRAVCTGGGAFHPKLIVAVGDEHAAVLIGSGNVSPGGWIDNAELWTLLRASLDDGAPDTVARVADFLTDLPSALRLSPGVADVLSDVSDRLRAFPSTSSGPTLVSSLWGPIIDQLPEVAVSDRLLVAAPFHDREAAATRRLAERFGAKTVEVLHQDDTVFDGARLAAVLNARNGKVAAISDRRYHHGKLVEWETDGQIWALTGSANASGAALLRGMSDDGNCELGLVGKVEASLRPDTAAVVSPDAVTDHEWESDGDQTADVPAGLFAALLEPSGVRVMLRAPLPSPASLQYRADDQWALLETVPAGEAEFVVSMRLPGASALRLLYADGTTSNVVWVADLARTGFRSVAASSSPPGDPVEMALDPKLITMVETALATVRAWVAEVPEQTSATSASTATSAAKRESWRDFIDGFRSEVGDEFSFFVLPHLMRAAGAEPSGVHAAVGDEAEDDEVATEEAEDDTVNERLQRLRRDARMAERLRSYRRMCERLAQPEPRPHPVRVAAVSLAIGGAALGCWSDRSDLAAHLRTCLRRLAVVADDPDLRIDAANVAAVALAIIGSLVRSGVAGDEVATTYRLAGREVKPLLAHVTPEGVADHASGVVGAVFGPVVAPARVLGVADAIVAPDPIGDAAETLAVDHGLDCELDGTCIRILGEVTGDPRRHVLRAIGYAQDADAVGAMAAGPKGSVAAAWCRPQLVLVQRTAIVRVTLYKFTSMMRPADISHTEGFIPSQYERGNWYGLDEVPEKVEEILMEGGILLEDC